MHYRFWTKIPCPCDPKSWKCTVLVEAHDKLGHQGNSCTYCLVKRQYYWKGMNKDIRKYIANCTLCDREKAKIQHYPLQMMEIPDRPFDKIAVDLITECDTSTSDNKHILTIIDHLTEWPKAFPIPDKTADTVVSTFINNSLMDQVLQQLGIDRIFSEPYHSQSNDKLEVFHKYLKPTWKNFMKKVLLTGISILIKYSPVTEQHQTWQLQKHHSSRYMEEIQTFHYINC